MIAILVTVVGLILFGMADGYTAFSKWSYRIKLVLFAVGVAVSQMLQDIAIGHLQEALAFSYTESFYSVAAVIATDIKADDFFTIITQTLLPFLIFIIFLILLITILTLIIIMTSRRYTASLKESAAMLAQADEKLKVLDKMKSEFVSIASHQLRSPLTAIRGYTSMLLEGSFGALSKKSTEAVERIAESSRFMALSIEDYLNVSRIEAGNMCYEMSDFNLAEETEKLVDDMRPTAVKKGLVLMYRSDCDGSCVVNADIGKMRQVIQNLVDNAMKYTPKGSIDVIAHNDVATKKMRITVQDAGVRMDATALEDVFDKFVRAKNANNINTTGTGLGLFVAKKMVEEMGGAIAVTSEGEGKGSAFTVEMPTV